MNKIYWKNRQVGKPEMVGWVFPSSKGNVYYTRREYKKHYFGIFHSFFAISQELLAELRRKYHIVGVVCHYVNEKDKVEYHTIPLADIYKFGQTYNNDGDIQFVIRASDLKQIEKPKNFEENIEKWL